MIKEKPEYKFLGAIVGFIFFNILVYASFFLPIRFFFPPVAPYEVIGSRLFDDYPTATIVKFITSLLAWPTLNAILASVGFSIRKRLGFIAFAMMSFSIFGFFLSSVLSLVFWDLGAWVPPY